MLRMRLVTTVTAFAELFAGLESNSLAETVTEDESSEFVVVVTMAVTVALAPTPSEPRLAMRELPATEMEPWLALVEMRRALAGKIWLRVMVVAVLGPRLVTLVM